MDGIATYVDYSYTMDYSLLRSQTVVDLGYTRIPVDCNEDVINWIAQFK